MTIQEYIAQAVKNIDVTQRSLFELFGGMISWEPQIE